MYVMVCRLDTYISYLLLLLNQTAAVVGFLSGCAQSTCCWCWWILSSPAIGKEAAVAASP